MRKLLINLTILSLCWSLHAQTDSKEERKVLQTVKAWNDAFESNLPDSYFNYIHEDLTIFFPTNPYRIEQRILDEQEFRWSLRNERTKVHLFQELQPMVQLWDQTAVVTYHSRMVIGKEGEEQLVYLKETNVLVKEGDGWRIVHIHVSR